MSTTFGATTLEGYIETWSPQNDVLVFRFPGTDTNRTISHGRGPTKITLTGHAATEATWNAIRGPLTDGVSRTLTYRDFKGSATNQKMDCVAQLTDARPFGTGWNYTVLFTAQDPIPKDAITGLAEYT